MKDTEAAYLAGLLDGEGSYMVRKVVTGGGRYELWEAVISMSTTDDLLTWRCRELAGGYVSGPTRPKQPNARPAWIWTLKGRAVGPTIEAMWPYIVLKRQQAAILHRLRSITKPGARPGSKGVIAMDEDEKYLRETLRLACRALNHRGNEPRSEEMVIALASARLLDLITAPSPAPVRRTETACQPQPPHV